MSDESQKILPGSYTAATLPRLSPKAQLLWDEFNQTAAPLNTDTAGKPARVIDSSPPNAVRLKD